MNKNGLQRSGFDHILATLGGVFSTYSLGVSINRPALGQILAVGVIIASLIGYGLSVAFRNSRLVKLDGVLLAILGFVAVLTSPSVNRMLPDEGLPINLMVATTLSMIVMLGSLVAWRDATLLFLSLPSVAIFGLVGVFDAWRPSVALFYIFLICVAVLYARAYLRTMMERAEKMGADVSLLRRDVWKWVAGPEWAFVSAGTVALLSLMLGPLIQFTLSPVTGAVKINAPAAIANAPKMPFKGSPDFGIGRGPTNLTEAPIFRIKMASPEYLRRFTFFKYENGGWYTTYPQSPENLIQSVATSDTETALEPTHPSPYEPIDKPRQETVTYMPIGVLDSILPAPGVITKVKVPAGSVKTLYDQVSESAAMVTGTVDYTVELPASDGATSQPAILPSAYPKSWIGEMGFGIPDSIRNKAKEITQGINTDYAKCQAISRYIGSTCAYNTKAAAYSPDRDPVEVFLFERKEGYCDLFASAFVQMARSVGIPARVSTGYLVQDHAVDDEGYHVVRDKQSHAWGEVYFRGVGWLPFDATEGATDLQSDVAPTAKKSGLSSEQILTIALQVGMGLFVAILIGAGAWIGLRYVRLRRSSGQVLIDMQNRFQLSVERLTMRPRRFSQSISEYITVSAATLGSHLNDCKELAMEFETVMFSGRTTSPEVLSALKTRSEALNNILRTEAKARSKQGNDKQRS